MIDFEVGILAPNVAVDGSAILLLDKTLLGQADFSIQLDHSEQRVRSKPIPSTCLSALQGIAATRLVVEVHIGDECKGSRTFKLLSERITDFEGRLTVDPQKLEVNDAEYEEILRRL